VMPPALGKGSSQNDPIMFSDDDDKSFGSAALPDTEDMDMMVVTTINRYRDEPQHNVPTHWNVINVSSEWVSTHLVGHCVRIHYVFFIQKIVPCVIKENIKPVPVLNEPVNVFGFKFVVGYQTSLAKAPSELSACFEPVAEVSGRDMCTMIFV
jgi:hypothetical protein